MPRVEVIPAGITRRTTQSSFVCADRAADGPARETAPRMVRPHSPSRPRRQPARARQSRDRPQPVRSAAILVSPWSANAPNSPQFSAEIDRADPRLSRGYARPTTFGLDRSRPRFKKTKAPQAKCLKGLWFWLRGQDLNLRPSGYEPDELPDCSTPRQLGCVV